MNYTKTSAVESVKRNGLRIHDDCIYIPIGMIVGNKTWGAIDYLVKQHGFAFYFEEAKYERNTINSR